MRDNENKIFGEITHPDTVPCMLQRPMKTLKRAPGLGRLNRLIASSMKVLVANGHVNRRFVRCYASGVAVYVCPRCQAPAAVGLGEGRGETHTAGEAFEVVCNPVTI